MAIARNNNLYHNGGKMTPNSRFVVKRQVCPTSKDAEWIGVGDVFVDEDDKAWHIVAVGNDCVFGYETDPDDCKRLNPKALTLKEA